jgi:hypothetical protein
MPKRKETKTPYGYYIVIFILLLSCAVLGIYWYKKTNDDLAKITLLNSKIMPHAETTKYSITAFGPVDKRLVLTNGLDTNNLPVNSSLNVMGVPPNETPKYNWYYTVNGQIQLSLDKYDTSNSANNYCITNTTPNVTLVKCNATDPNMIWEFEKPSQSTATDKMYIKNKTNCLTNSIDLLKTKPCGTDPYADNSITWIVTKI